MKERTCLLIEYTSDSLPSPRPSRYPLARGVSLTLYRSAPRFSSLLSSLSAAALHPAPVPTPAPAAVYACSPSYFNYCSHTLVHLLLTPPFPSPPNRLRVYPSSSSTISKLFFLPWPLRQPPNHPLSPRCRCSVFSVPLYGLLHTPAPPPAPRCLSGRAKIVLPFLPPLVRSRSYSSVSSRSPRTNELAIPLAPSPPRTLPSPDPTRDPTRARILAHTYICTRTHTHYCRRPPPDSRPDRESLLCSLPNRLVE